MHSAECRKPRYRYDSLSEIVERMWRIPRDGYVWREKKVNFKMVKLGRKARRSRDFIGEAC